MKNLFGPGSYRYDEIRIVAKNYLYSAFLDYRIAATTEGDIAVFTDVMQAPESLSVRKGFVLI